MTTTRTTCDKCGAEIRADRVRLVVEGATTSPAWPADPSTGRPTLDLCGGCSERLAEWLAKGPRP